MTQEKESAPRLIGYAILDEGGVDESQRVVAWPFVSLGFAKEQLAFIVKHGNPTKARVVGLLTVEGPCNECPVCPECLRPGYMMPDCGYNMSVEHYALSQWHAQGHPEEQAEVQQDVVAECETCGSLMDVYQLARHDGRHVVSPKARS